MAMDTTFETRIADVQEAHQKIQEAVNQYIIGNPELTRQIFIGILTGGHILVDGLPGTAKTSIGKIIARILGFDFKRIQGAIDVQPADILGIRVYDRESKEFSLKKGPIFNSYVLIDEINRLTPKTQGALLEAMSERQTTIDGVTYTLPDPYVVVATQNNLDKEGTFPLIYVQKDRFMSSIALKYLDADGEMMILKYGQGGLLDWEQYQERVKPVLTLEQVRQAKVTAQQVYADDAILQYIRDLVIATRNHREVRFGASPRATLALLAGSKAWAAIDNRPYVLPDDVKTLATPIFRHRLVLAREAEIGRISTEDVIKDILESVEVP
jgi:MoxR-like ATPase